MNRTRTRRQVIVSLLLSFCTFPTSDAQSRALSKMPIGHPQYIITQPVLIVQFHTYMLCYRALCTSPGRFGYCKTPVGLSQLFRVVCIPAWLQVIVFDSKLRVMYVHHHPPFSENSKKAQIQSCGFFGWNPCFMTVCLASMPSFLQKNHFGILPDVLTPHCNQLPYHPWWTRFIVLSQSVRWWQKSISSLRQSLCVWWRRAWAVQISNEFITLIIGNDRKFWYHLIFESLEIQCHV